MCCVLLYLTCTVLLTDVALETVERQLISAVFISLLLTSSAEILISDKYRKNHFTSAPTVSGIDRVQTIKILGVIFSNKLSMHDHVHNTIKGCAPILYALRILRAYGMNQPALHTVNQAVIMAKLHQPGGLLHHY